MPNRDEVTEAVRSIAKQLGRAPSRSEFYLHSGMTQHQLLSNFDSWNDAVAAAGLEPNTSRARIEDELLISDWGKVVRRLREIPTTVRYRREGEYSMEVFSRFGAWVKMPDVFRDFANDKPEWADVVALLPQVTTAHPPTTPTAMPDVEKVIEARFNHARHSKLADRPTYGNPIDFRGLRHEPVDEQGVVFLFGMIANELGYMVEGVQTGYPDCEAKRQVGPNNWQTRAD